MSTTQEAPPVKRTLIGAAVIALGLSGMATSFAGTDDGQGAQKRALVLTDEGATNSDCTPGADQEGGPNGFVILNAAGKVGDINKVVGEVSLKNAPGMYEVDLAVDGKCTPQGMFTTNDEGNGNFHINLPSGFGSSYFVVLRNATAGTSFASAAVPLI
jgi:hypothetical protein